MTEPNSSTVDISPRTKVDPSSPALTEVTSSGVDLPTPPLTMVNCEGDQNTQASSVPPDVTPSTPNQLDKTVESDSANQNKANEITPASVNSMSVVYSKDVGPSDKGDSVSMSAESSSVNTNQLIDALKGAQVASSSEVTNDQSQNAATLISADNLPEEQDVIQEPGAGSGPQVVQDASEKCDETEIQSSEAPVADDAKLSLLTPPTPSCTEPVIQECDTSAPTNIPDQSQSVITQSGVSLEPLPQTEDPEVATSQPETISQAAVQVGTVSDGREECQPQAESAALRLGVGDESADRNPTPQDPLGVEESTVVADTPNDAQVVECDTLLKTSGSKAERDDNLGPTADIPPDVELQMTKSEAPPETTDEKNIDLRTGATVEEGVTEDVPHADKSATSLECQAKLEGAVSDGHSDPPDDAQATKGEDLMHVPLQHSVSAVTKVKDPNRPRRRKRKPTEFVKSPVPSKADASADREADAHDGPAVFEAQPRLTKVADVSYKADTSESCRTESPSTFEKAPAPSCADVSFSTELTSSQKKAVFSSHASPSMADVNYASPTPTKCTTSLFVSPPKESTADTGANAAGLSSGISAHKSVYESEARPSLAAARASDPVPQSSTGPALFTKDPAETKAHARAGVEVARDPTQTISVYESSPITVPVAAKWCDPVVAKNSGSVFESKATPSNADAAADRSLDSDDEYETDTDEE